MSEGSSLPRLKPRGAFPPPVISAAVKTWDYIDPSEFKNPTFLIAARLGGDPLMVRRILAGSPIHSRSPQRLYVREPKRKIVAKIARRIDDLVAAMQEMPEDWRAGIAQRRGVSCEVLEALSNSLHSTTKDAPPKRQGGRGLAAYMVADSMRRLFRRFRRPITFGINPNTKGPSTEFGRAVAFGLKAFDLKADWRNPAQQAARKHKEVLSRLARRKQSREKGASSA